MDDSSRRAVQRLAARQEGAVSRSQVLQLGGTAAWLASQVAARRWQRLWPGVYATTTGQLSFVTRAQGALLYAGPGAVLGPQACAFLHGIASAPPRNIDVLVPTRRRVTSQPRLSVRRADLERLGTGAGAPAEPSAARLPLAATVLALVEAAPTADALVATLCAAVRAGCTPAGLRAEVARRPRVRRRALVLDVLDDVGAGIESPLERRYHHAVERRQDLPTAALQQRQVLGGLRLRADRVHRGLGVRIELDGTLAHPGGRTDRDAWRDNEVGIGAQELTLRYRWSHVLGQPCRTADQVARALRSRGWTGAARPCGPRCVLSGGVTAQRGGSGVPRPPDLPR